MKRGIPVLVCFIALTACKNMGSGPVLSQKQMVPILYELMLGEEYAAQLKGKDSTLGLDSLTAKKYDAVFALQQTNLNAFNSSYAYYMQHPDKMKAIYDSVDALGKRKRLEIMHPKHNASEKSKRTNVNLRKDSI
jgi:Domain of unknown function (DUF4296)